MDARNYDDEDARTTASHNQRERNEKYDREDDVRLEEEAYENNNARGHDRDYGPGPRGGGYNRQDEIGNRNEDGSQRRDDDYTRYQCDSRRDDQSYDRESRGYGRLDNGSRKGGHHDDRRQSEEIYDMGQSRRRDEEEDGNRRDDPRDERRNLEGQRFNNDRPPSHDRRSGNYQRNDSEYDSRHEPQRSEGPSEGFGRDEYNDRRESYGQSRHTSRYDDPSGDGELFSSTLDSLLGHRQRLQEESLDENRAVQAHQQMYGGSTYGSGQAATSDNMGSAAAMQALKMFTGGQGSQQQGGNTQESFIRMAMGEAAQLFDQQSAQGNAHPNANKQDAVASAAQLALKMFMKSQTDGGSGGSGLMGLASRFL